jgi:hypothetical protein
MKFKVALTIIAASFLIVPSVFADRLPINNFGGEYGGGTGGSGSLCPLSTKSISDLSQAVTECQCFLDESVASGDYYSFFIYLYENVSSANIGGVSWADQWAYWGWSVVTNRQFTAGQACKQIFLNLPPRSNNCYIRCRR